MSERSIAMIKKIPVFIIVLIFSITALIPFYIMFIMGTYKNEDIFTGFKFLPGDYILQNLKTIGESDFVRCYFNSIIISALSVIGGLFSSSLAGYGLSKFKFKGRNIFYTILLGTLMLPYQISMVGSLMEMRWLHLNNTLAPMFIPFFAIPFGVFWMTQYIGSAIPDSILDSARLDGCSEFYLFAKVVFPIIKPASITLTLLIFLWSWNNFLIPLVFVTDPKNYTVPLAISVLGAVHRTDYAAKMLSLTIATIPVLVFFGVFSKYLIKGMTIGAVKE